MVFQHSLLLHGNLQENLEGRENQEVPANQRRNKINHIVIILCINAGYNVFLPSLLLALWDPLDRKNPADRQKATTQHAHTLTVTARHYRGCVSVNEMLFPTTAPGRPGRPLCPGRPISPCSPLAP